MVPVGEYPMNQTQSFGKYKEFLLENIPADLKRYIFGEIRNRKRLLPEQESVLQDYYIYLVTECPKIKKHNSYLNAVIPISHLGRTIRKPFGEFTKDDLKGYLLRMQLGKYKEGTINEHKVKIKSFFSFLFGKDNPEQVSWIQISQPPIEAFPQDKCIKKSEILAMARSADNARDAAIVAVLYESAARVSEFLSMTTGHIIAHQHGLKIKVPKTKTKERAVPLIDSVPFLQQWLNNHPKRNLENAPLFCSLEKNFGGRMSAQHVGRILKTLAARAGIQKRIYPHLLRHSRLNHWAHEDNLNERDLRFLAGWSDSSEMPRRYLHYGEEEVHNKLLENAGMLTDENKQEAEIERLSLRPQDCPKCSKQNTAVAEYCCGCGQALNLKRYLADQELVNQQTNARLKAFADIMSDPVKRAKYEEFKKIMLAGSDAV